MKAFLMHRDQDFDLERDLPSQADELIQDLELSTLFEAMALGDEFLLAVARQAVLSGLTNPEMIIYRQNIVRDCLENASVVREIYNIAVESIHRQKRIYRGLFRSPDTTLHGCVEVLELFMEMLKRLRSVVDENAVRFRSEGFSRLFAMITTELDDAYFKTVNGHLKRLRFRDGVLISAGLGKGNKGINYILRKPPSVKPGLIERITTKAPPSYTIVIPDRDEAGARALSELRGRGIDLVANALAQSTDHILDFFGMLRTELGFYVGCINLHEKLAKKGEPACFPEPLDSDATALSFRGLYDVCLALHLAERAVGNDVDADGMSLILVTGANQGGKSTFLRSVGLSQLMMQCGMFVAAESFRANVCEGLFTHYKREEDATMESGKLDEELSRMSDIADSVTQGCVVLCNESFAATNEREGSEIARQIVRALREAGVKVIYVTHLFDLAHGLFEQGLDTALFLRAPRQEGGLRTFKLAEGKPLSTSYGADLYQRIFQSAPDVAAASRSVSPRGGDRNEGQAGM